MNNRNSSLDGRTIRKRKINKNPGSIKDAVYVTKSVKRKRIDRGLDTRASRSEKKRARIKKMHQANSRTHFVWINVTEIDAIRYTKRHAVYRDLAMTTLKKLKIEHAGTNPCNTAIVRHRYTIGNNLYQTIVQRQAIRIAYDKALMHVSSHHEHTVPENSAIICGTTIIP